MKREADADARHAPGGWDTQAEPFAQFRVLQRVHDNVLSGGSGPDRPRPVIAASWQRSLAARVNPDDQRPALAVGLDRVDDVRAEHPLREVLPILRHMLVDIADASQHIMIVTDAEGLILWLEGASAVRLEADPVGLCEGTRWDEQSIGTNGMGTALAIDAPVLVHSAEHLVRTYHTWTCAAAPVHDPESGQLLGAIDISGHLQALHPALANLVIATAQLAEGHLRMQMAVRDEKLRARNMVHLLNLRGEAGALLTQGGRVLAAQPDGHWPERVTIHEGKDRVLLDDGREAVLEPLPDGYLIRIPQASIRSVRPPALSLSFLRHRAAAMLDGQSLSLSLRHAEILALLALYPAGLTAEQLALHLYGEDGNPTTVRGEIHRLRNLLGPAVLPTRPYQLRAEIDADFLAVKDALSSGNVGAALGAYQAPLLDRSDAPAIRDERDEIDAALRRAVLRQRNLDILWTYSQRGPGGDDLEVLGRLARELPPQDMRQPIAQARLRRLLSSTK